eukprot:scaffold30336_cov135-Isochrysis_galbana.AAC.1
MRSGRGSPRARRLKGRREWAAWKGSRQRVACEQQVACTVGVNRRFEPGLDRVGHGGWPDRFVLDGASVGFARDARRPKGSAVHRHHA